MTVLKPLRYEVLEGIKYAVVKFGTEEAYIELEEEQLPTVSALLQSPEHQ